MSVLADKFAALQQTANDLSTAKYAIIDAITEMEGTVNEGDGFADFPTAIRSIPKGGGDMGTGDYWVKVIDYDGTVLAEKRLNDGDTYTLPEPPTHDRLTFQAWSSSTPIVDGVVTCNKNNIMVGAVYKTTSGATEIDITLTAVTGTTFLLKFYKTAAGTMVIDWGDSSTEDVTGTGSMSLSHAYASVGDYTIKIIFDGAYYFDTYISNNTTSVVNYTIRRVFMSDKVTSISGNAFNNCRSLSTIVIPQGVTTIGSDAFRSCYSLSTIVIPQGVTSIGSYAFSSCNSLSTIVIPQGVTTIGTYAFNGCFPLSTIVIPQGVTSIGNNAFYSCYSLSSIVIPQGVTTIGSSAFYYCYSLSSVVIPQGVTTIGDDAFYNCRSLSTIVIPQGVTSIGGSAFNNCYPLILYDFTACTSVPTLSATNAFTNINQACRILVPAALVSAWKTATNWATYANYIVGV